MPSLLRARRTMPESRAVQPNRSRRRPLGVLAAACARLPAQPLSATDKRPDDAAAHLVHALIRDGACASLLKTQRREFHMRVSVPGGCHARSADSSMCHGLSASRR
jgi:hypothetical protein